MRFEGDASRWRRFDVSGGLTASVQTDDVTCAHYALSSPRFQFSPALQGCASVQVCAQARRPSALIEVNGRSCRGARADRISMETHASQRACSGCSAAPGGQPGRRAGGEISDEPGRLGSCCSRSLEGILSPDWLVGRRSFSEHAKKRREWNGMRKREKKDCFPHLIDWAAPINTKLNQVQFSAEACWGRHTELRDALCSSTTATILDSKMNLNASASIL